MSIQELTASDLLLNSYMYAVSPMSPSLMMGIGDDCTCSMVMLGVRDRGVKVV